MIDDVNCTDLKQKWMFNFIIIELLKIMIFFFYLSKIFSRVFTLRMMNLSIGLVHLFGKEKNFIRRLPMVRWIQSNFFSVEKLLFLSLNKE